MKIHMIMFPMTMFVQRSDSGYAGTPQSLYTIVRDNIVFDITRSKMDPKNV